jgi:hypothetical protein
VNKIERFPYACASRTFARAILTGPLHGGRLAAADRISDLVALGRYCSSGSRRHRFPPRAQGCEARRRRKSQEEGRVNALEADNRTADIVRGVVLSKRLSKLVKAQAGQITAEDKEELNRLVMSQPSLKKKLDLKAAYRMPSGRWSRMVSRLSSNVMRVRGLWECVNVI